MRPDRQKNKITDGPVNFKKGLMLIWNNFKKYPKELVLALLLLLLTSAATISVTKFAEYSIDVNILEKDFAGLSRTALYMSLVILFSVILMHFRIKITAQTNQKVLFNIRRDIFNKLQGLPLKFFSDNQSGDIIQRLTGNVEGIGNFFSQGWMRILQIAFNSLFVIIFMYLTDWRLATIVTTGWLITFSLILFQGKFLEKHLSKMLKEEGILSAISQESLDGFLAIKTGNQEEGWINKFMKRNERYYQLTKKVSLISSIGNSSLSFMNIVTIFVVLLVSLSYFNEGSVTLGSIVIFVTFIQSLFGNMEGISQVWRNVKTGIASAERLTDILDLENDIKNSKDPYIPKKIEGTVEFKDVDFSYDNGNNVLSDVEFKVEGGKTVAIIGPTGAGKTTFVNLISRLYDVNSGEILVDGKNVKDWDLDTLRKQIGYLIQDTFLFEDSILNNLRYNNPQITKDDALEIFDLLGSKSFIDSLPKGLDTVIRTDNGNISSGQQQIIALARILLRNPKILILDEATSKIDTKSEKMVQEAIKKGSKGKTTFIIAHRLSTIFSADMIILIQENRILEKGNHEELLKKGGIYAEMYSTFSGK